MTGGAWWKLGCELMLLSLLQVGGAIAVAPDLHRLLVDELRLLGDAQFAASIAIAQASPGPNALYVWATSTRCGVWMRPVDPNPLTPRTSVAPCAFSRRRSSRIAIQAD